MTLRGHRNRYSRGLPPGVAPLAVALLAGAIGLCVHQTRTLRREVERLGSELADLTDHVRVPEPAPVVPDLAHLFRSPGAGTQAVLDVLAREARGARQDPPVNNPQRLDKRPE